MYEPPALPPPGWYPDPERAGSLRWWSGTEWALSSASFTAPTDQLPEVGAVLSGAFRRVVTRWRALLVLAIVASAVPTLLSLLAVRRLADGLAIVDDEFVGWSSDRVPGVIALAVGAAVAGWIGTLAIAWFALRSYDDDVLLAGDAPPQRTTGAELSAGLRALAITAGLLPRAIGWGSLGLVAVAVTLAVVVLVTAVVLPIGILLIIALLPLMAWIAVRAAFVPHAIADARGNPYSRSWVVSTERYWAVLGRLAVVMIVASAINYGASAVGTLASGAGVSGFGSNDRIEVDENGDVRDVELDEVVPLGTVTIVASSMAAVVSGLFGTSMVMAACAELYRTRNRPPD